MSLPLQNYHSYEHYVNDLGRAEKFYTQTLGYKTIGKSTPEADQRDGMQRLVMAGGKTIHLILTQPLRTNSVAGQYLNLHPEGIGFLNFRVKNLDRTVTLLKSRRATLLYDPVEIQDQHGTFRQVAIATAIDDVNIRFIEDTGYKNFAPSFIMTQQAGSYSSPHGFECIDHMTINVRTLQPLMAFYRDVLGFEVFWEVDFHTNDVNPDLPVGSGLKSTVMWHPDSGIKFANNEPAPPFFRNSQIDIYCRDNRGSGIQHVALRVPNILQSVPAMRKQGAKFLDAPQAYYDRVPERLKKAGFKDKIAEPMTQLASEAILIDGSSKGYLLQIFSNEMNRMLGDERCGALFYEIIQREGDDGFGAGNFRALFETIEIDQIAMQKTAKELPLELL